MNHGTEPRTAGESRPLVGITAAQVKAEFLDRSMEATAWNLRQFDPSPEVDSDLEHALAAAKAGDVKAAEHWILAAIEANQREGRQNRSISSEADRLATDLERGVIGAQIGIKAICRELRPILKGVEAGTADSFLAFHDLRRRVPADQLVSSGVKRELGKKLTVVLEGLI